MSKALQALSLCIALFSGLVASQAGVMTREQIIAEAETRAVAWFDAANWNFWARTWEDGVFFTGVADLARVSDEARLWMALDKVGNRNTKIRNIALGKWILMYHAKATEPHHADDMAIGEAFLAVYEKTRDPAILNDTLRRVDAASASILSKERAEKAAKAHELHWQEGLTWYWIDALFMAAPLHAHLSAITGNPSYIKAMHIEWKRASDLLYDQKEHLYFRDKKFLTKRSKSGKKIFWSRGNGWVMGAFARAIPLIPKDDPQRGWYINQFKEMAAKLASLQQPDGTWSPSLLDYERFPYSEMSGTVFYCFGIAWGINSGILDDKTYRPVVEKAWAAVLAAMTEEGNLGYIQGVGAEPDRVFADKFTHYGNGAYLMAAVQVAAMAPITVPPLPALRAAPRPGKKQ